MSWENLLKRQFSVYTYENQREFIVIHETNINQATTETSVYWGYGDENYPDLGDEIMVFQNKNIDYVKNWLKNWLNKKGYNNMLLLITDKNSEKRKERLA